MVYISIMIPEIRNYKHDGDEYAVAGISARELLENSRTDIDDFYGGSSEKEIFDFFENKWVPWGLFQTSYALSESLPTESYKNLLEGGNGKEDDENKVECSKDDKYEKCLERISIGLKSSNSMERAKHAPETKSIYKKTMKRGKQAPSGKSIHKKTRKSKTR